VKVHAKGLAIGGAPESEYSNVLKGLVLGRHAISGFCEQPNTFGNKRPDGKILQRDMISKQGAEVGTE